MCCSNHTVCVQFRIYVLPAEDHKFIKKKNGRTLKRGKYGALFACLVVCRPCVQELEDNIAEEIGLLTWGDYRFERFSADFPRIFGI